MFITLIYIFRQEFVVVRTFTVIITDLSTLDHEAMKLLK